MSVRGSYHCGALHGVGQIIWAQWRLIQLSAVSTPAGTAVTLHFDFQCVSTSLHTVKRAF